jgi:predicted NACHT family NTPase
VDVLLKKWDVKRNIEREQVYKRLSLKRKEDLLSQIARTTFEAGNYFFKQREVEGYVTQYIQNLPNASTDPEVLELDSVAVLKSIEAQHGLFVERARGIYSFSHLTFHEYLTARKIVTSCNPYAADDQTLQGLVNHLTEKRWQKVFLLTVGMLDSTDVLLGLMKDRTDSLLADDEKLQQFLRWVDEKARLVKTPYKVAAIRAFYFDCSYLIDDSNLLENAIDSRINSDLNHMIKFNEVVSSDIGLDFSLAFFDSELALKFVSNPELKEALQQVNAQRPNRDNQDMFKQWHEQLRLVAIEHRNIGHDWQFNHSQKERLDQYYDANKLLVDCLNSDCYVSREVRQEIEETLLLPIAQIKKYP